MKKVVKRIIRRKKVAKPIRSTKEQLNNALRTTRFFLRHAVDQDSRELMKKIVNRAKQGSDSKKLYSRNGRYTPSRAKIHNTIIRSILKQDTRTKSPDVYVLGGVAGSGKSSVLKKFIKEKALTINNDDIKGKLAKYDPSPIKKYPLIHASYLHEESSDIEKKVLARAIASKKDIILDRTLASYVKNRKLLESMKKRGYRVTVLGTNLPPHIALIRATSRFVREGRYVPLGIVATKGNKTNSSVLKMAKQKFVTKARVYSTKNKKPKLLYKKG